MTSEDPRIKNALWWITSIAISVVCCSSLFVLFANYLVDIKNDLREVNARITIMEQRGNTILANIELLRQKIAPQIPNEALPKASLDTPIEPGIALEGKSVPTGEAGPAAGELVPATSAVVAPVGSHAPAVVPVPAPAVAAPVAPAVVAPTMTAPVVSVPSIASPTEKK